MYGRLTRFIDFVSIDEFVEIGGINDPELECASSHYEHSGSWYPIISLTTAFNYLIENLLIELRSEPR